MSSDAPSNELDALLSPATKPRRKRPPAPPEASVATEPESTPNGDVTGAGMATEAACEPWTLPEDDAPPAPANLPLDMLPQAMDRPLPEDDAPPESSVATEPTEPGTCQEQLSAIYAAALNGSPKAETVGRLIDLRPKLAPTEEVLSLLHKLRAVRGYAGVVDPILKELPQAKPPRVVDLFGESEENLNSQELPRGLPALWSDPPGYRMNRYGVFKTVQKGEAVFEIRLCRRPIWIDRRWEDVDHKEQQVRLCWEGGSVDVGREIALSSKDLVKLAGRGAPVSSATASGIVDWLDASENQNRGIITVETSISRLGWTDGERGKTLQTPDGPHRLRAEEGSEQVERAVRKVGSSKAWKAAALIVNKHPVAALMLAASVASVLLEPSDGKPFVVDLHGHSSRGKTTALRWAVSAWGDPSDAAAYLLPWNATNAAIEARAGFLKHLPVALDDTKKLPLKDRPRLSSVVYDWAGGQGKARGRPDGARRLVTWRSILLSTGEAPLIRLAGEHTGLRMRVLSFGEAPFGNHGVDAVKAVEGLESWGHLGPRVAEWAVRNWEGLKERRRKYEDAAAKKIASGPQAARVAGYVASIKLATYALKALDVLTHDQEAAVYKLCIKSAKEAIESADIATEAYHRIVSWLVANQDRLHPVTYDEARKYGPVGGYIGRRTSNSSLVNVTPSALEGELTQLGYDPAEILPQWKQKGRINCEDNAGWKKVVSWEGKSSRMYELKWVEEEEPKQPA